MDVGVSGLVIFDCHFANMNLVEEVPPTTTAAQGSLAKMGVAGGLFCVARFMGRYGGSYSADMRKRFADSVFVPSADHAMSASDDGSSHIRWSFWTKRALIGKG